MSNPMTDLASSEAAEDAFYQALRSGDAHSVMQVWAQENEIICIHPNGPRLQGWQAIETSWETILEHGGIEVETVKQVCMIGPGMAVHNLIEEITIRGDKNHDVVLCYATNVYVQDASGWRMIMHHSAPAEEEPTGHSSAGEVLH